jgi:hypothetical protein
MDDTPSFCVYLGPYIEQQTREKQGVSNFRIVIIISW